MTITEKTWVFGAVESWSDTGTSSPPVLQDSIAPLRFMSDILKKTTVLVLNRNWQAINVRTPQEAFCQMATNVATALEIEGNGHIRPVTWAEWIVLPIRAQDQAVQTVRGPIRLPTVIVAVNYAKVPKKRPKLCT